MHTFSFPSEETLASLFRRHDGDPVQNGWCVRMRHKFGYFTPEAWYQAVVDNLVTDESKWIDVGGGKSIFPFNEKLSCELAERSDFLVGVDPSDNINQNDLVNERSQTMIEDYQTDETFDLATLRMVAEHIEHPEIVIDKLAQLIRPTGHVVIYTPNKWSILSIMASLIPDKFHASFARLISSGRKDEDVFPTCYKMNTRNRLRELFEEGGFKEVGFAHLDDCVVLQQYPFAYRCELTLWKLFRLIRLRYPENNILGIYQRQ
ncbi:MAG: hypothetical protein COA78_31975 [Blastopirellula sp.]|nr:MAG: hypothetical protein COA78_31975 [Blastopirellula sp.]